MHERDRKSGATLRSLQVQPKSSENCIRLDSDDEEPRVATKVLLEAPTLPDPQEAIAKREARKKAEVQAFYILFSFFGEGLRIFHILLFVKTAIQINITSKK